MANLLVGKALMARFVALTQTFFFFLSRYASAIYIQPNQKITRPICALPCPRAALFNYFFFGDLTRSIT